MGSQDLVSFSCATELIYKQEKYWCLISQHPVFFLSRITVQITPLRQEFIENGSGSWRGRSSSPENRGVWMNEGADAHGRAWGIWVDVTGTECVWDERRKRKVGDGWAASHHSLLCIPSHSRLSFFPSTCLCSQAQLFMLNLFSYLFVMDSMLVHIISKILYLPMNLSCLPVEVDTCMSSLCMELIIANLFCMLRVCYQI